MLPRLVEYERRKAARESERQLPNGYRWRQVMGLIDLATDGLSFNPVTLVTVQGKRRVGKEMAVPDRIRTSDTDSKPLLLADTAEFVLAVPPADQSKRGRTQARHQRFVALVRECASETKEPEVAAVLHFLEGGKWKGLQLPEGFEAGDLVTFRVDGAYVLELSTVQRFWAQYLAKAGEADAARRRLRRSLGAEAADTSPSEGPRGTCLVCGTKDAPIARLHLKVRGVPGNPAGTSLVSCNDPSTWSYGQEQAYNAPVCQECADAYVRGLNRLIRGEDTSLRVEQVAYTFWTREPERFSVAKMLSRPEPQDVQALLESPWKARAPAPVVANAFYAMALSANKGRAVVRDWIESTLPEAQENLRRYFLRQRIVPLFGEEPRPFPIRELVRSLAPQQVRRRPGESNEPPDAAVALVHSALLGSPLPDWMLFLAVRRNHAEQGPVRRDRYGRYDWARAALIKLALQSQTPEFEPDKEGYMDTETYQSPAYLCGRLLALLEQAQSAAIPGAKATLIDRFYGSASSAPASVFGLLLKNAQNHLAKLQRDNRGAYTNIQRGLEEVISQLGQQLPRVLTLREQAVFALGYYYQRAARWGRQAVQEEPQSKSEPAQSPES